MLDHLRELYMPSGLAPHPNNITNMSNIPEKTLMLRNKSCVVFTSGIAKEIKLKADYWSKGSHAKRQEWTRTMNYIKEWKQSTGLQEFQRKQGKYHSKLGKVPNFVWQDHLSASRMEQESLRNSWIKTGASDDIDLAIYNTALFLLHSKRCLKVVIVTGDQRLDGFANLQRKASFKKRLDVVDLSAKSFEDHKITPNAPDRTIQLQIQNLLCNLIEGAEAWPKRSTRTKQS